MIQELSVNLIGYFRMVINRVQLIVQAPLAFVRGSTSCVNSAHVNL